MDMIDRDSWKVTTGGATKQVAAPPEAPNLMRVVNGTIGHMRLSHMILDRIEDLVNGPSPCVSPKGDSPRQECLMNDAVEANASASAINDRLERLATTLGASK
jgi:hypothetical protein